MNKWIGVIISLVIILVLFPVINSQTDTYNELTINESFTAEEVLATPEVVTVENTPDDVNGVYLNGTALTLTTEYTVSGADVTVLADVSDVDDVIVVNYTYTYDTSSGLDAVMAVFGTVVLVGALGWFAYAMFLRKR